MSNSTDVTLLTKYSDCVVKFPAAFGEKLHSNQCILIVLVAVVVVVAVALSQLPSVVSGMI